jgi:drug/metabolite transporter (DMT)-like permease
MWIFFVTATWRSLGTVGVVIGLAFFAALVWLFTSLGWFSLTSQSAITWAALVMIACLLTIGLCWALIQRRITGQTIVEEGKR